TKVESGELVSFDKQVRHRLIGLDGWGIVAEIWKHEDTHELSTEDDIVRLKDDFGR
ncbi:MAG: phosphoheptose isomerase, partial [Candidatus Saccharibacteria bacterium]